FVRRARQHDVERIRSALRLLRGDLAHAVRTTSAARQRPCGQRRRIPLERRAVLVRLRADEVLALGRDDTEAFLEVVEVAPDAPLIARALHGTGEPALHAFDIGVLGTIPLRDPLAARLAVDRDAAENAA